MPCSQQYISQLLLLGAGDGSAAIDSVWFVGLGVVGWCLQSDFDRISTFTDSARAGYIRVGCWYLLGC